VDPEILRPAFRIAVLVAGLALATLPFQPRDSAEFVVTVLAAIVGLVFAIGIGLLARLARPPLPPRRDARRKTARPKPQ
jgi:hypothetical protein